MPKEIPACPQKPNPKLDAVHHYEIELVTPMFGGGVETRVNDSTFPIRPTSIRGQLQFWWRATVGAQYATPEELRAAQTEVWGSTEQASRVQVQVDDVKADSPSPCASIDWDPTARQGKGGWRINWKRPFNEQSSALSYALFPFQGELPPPNRNARIDVPPAECIRHASFRLTLRCPENLWPKVEPALWAWINFGGLGSRSRRGCGAIYCRDFVPKDFEDLELAWKRYVPELFAQRKWPTLSSTILAGTERPDSITAWDYVIDKFKYYRQGIGMGRNGDNPKYPKRSRWPEPEAVRMTTRQRLPKHSELNTSNLVAFPRAELGLPIVFHFKDEDTKNPKNLKADPQQTVLYPSAGPGDNSRERMASPLILRPLVLQNGKALPVILRLQTPPLGGVDLRLGVTSLPLPTSTAIRDPRLSTYPNSPLAGVPSGSAIDAFLAFSKSDGFKEVKR